MPQMQTVCSLTIKRNFLQLNGLRLLRANLSVSVRFCRLISAAYVPGFSPAETAYMLSRRYESPVYTEWQPDQYRGWLAGGYRGGEISTRGWN